MKYTPQPKLLILLVVVLLVSNITTIVTIVYLQRHIASPETSVDVKSDADSELPRGMFFRDKLDLDDEHLDLFRGFHQNYNRTTRSITAELEAKRQEMVNELGKEHSDTLQLHELAHEIGTLHTELKEMTIDYYLDMKAHCNSDQRLILNEVFNGLLNKDGNVTLPGKGGQHRWGQKRRNN